MPAIRFFAFRKNMFDIEREKNGIHYMAMTDIQTIAIADTNYAKELRSNFRSMVVGADKKRLAFKVLDANNKEDMKIVVKNLTAAFDLKSKVMGLSR